ncbi:pentatricopeptide repeat-containing protein At3g18110, chloroplastic isoform X2 [Malania oleifera]|uniref:pentatricopeptide repeat-containing protein At3g18110, chloroplastic isoform X2 n=1 Tax=Malania oleifera TaxID=397392 RepID=UPI0025AE74EF|nr:pentatricopeptide repeat-containing protein At3g18110, chloroplastic isoform X2 [Malania oleifera]
MAGTGVLAFSAPPSIHGDVVSKVRTSGRDSTVSSSVDCAPSSSATTSENVETHKFSYSRASPSVRWPHLKLTETRPPPQTQFTVASPPPTWVVGDAVFPANTPDSEGLEETQMGGFAEALDMNGESVEVLSRPSRTKMKMRKLTLIRDKNWRQRVQILTDRILGLKSDEFVADVLDKRIVQMTPTDFCFVVKWVGQTSWQRALEVYEWLNLRHWYSPNARMLAMILSVLGKANQEALAVEIFARAEPAIGNTVQVYNAMMGVYARNGRFGKVQELLDVMHKRGCEPNLVSFNTLINARVKSGSLIPNLAFELLNEVRRSGLKPDVITYNTLISACSRQSDLEAAVKVYADMEAHNCQPDLWTYNAMISVCGRCGFASKGERLFKKLESRGFTPDAVTYNSLLYAFAREGNVKKVEEICEEMVKMGFGKDEMTYNTIIHMYGKQGRHDLALQLYNEMKLSGRNPDAVTFTVLIDSLGKASKITEAANVMSEMLDIGVKPTLRTFSALISGYAKAGKRVEAEDTFHCMLRSGIKPDQLAYSVMLDIFLRFTETKKAMVLYHGMVHDGFTPDPALYEDLLRVLVRENKQEEVVKIVEDMRQLCNINPQIISSILVKCNCYDQAANMLRLAISQGLKLDRENLLSILSSYSSSGRHSEALNLLDFLRKHPPGSHQLLTEALVITLCKSHQLDAALEEYQASRGFGLFTESFTMFESLIQCCEENELFAKASQVFSEMRFYGMVPSQNIFHCMVPIYCKMGFPETAHCVLNQAEERGISVDNISLYVLLIEAYGKLKLWEKAEGLASNIRQRYMAVDRKIWTALMHAYATSGCYERARAVFNTMMRDGPYPTVDSINSLLQALINDGRLDELYVVVQELQDMGFKMSKSSILLMLDAFAQAGNIFEVKKIYHGMKAAGYIPTMHLYKVMIALLSRGKRVRDVEAMVAEMEEMGFKPDLSVWNTMLKLYTGIEDFKKSAQIYQRIQKDGLTPDEDTYNTLIVMCCRDRRPEEGLSLMHEMRRLGLDPKLDTYKSLISACGKQQLWEEAEELFSELQLNGCKLDRSFYHIMMKIFRSSGNHSKAENLLVTMKERGVEPTIATMHLLMVSYGTSGQPQEAEKVLYSLKETGSNISTLPYSSVIDAYLKNGDYNVGIQKLLEMQKDGLDPDHRIWTCFIRAASLSERTSEALILLSALRDAGFDLPLRLLMEKSDSIILKVDQYMEKLESVKDDAAFNFVNALEDLLWAFELRSTASWVFQLAIKRNIYRRGVFRVADKDWGADFRKLSAGAALVGLTLWLDHMQDASLQGFPESPKSVVLITAFKDITERLGPVRPKKFARLALLSNERRDKAIRADIEGAKEKLEKMNRMVCLTRGKIKKKKRMLRRRKFIRTVLRP